MASGKPVKLVYQVNVDLTEQEIARIKEILKYATLSEIARLDASKDLKASVLDDATLGGPFGGPTMGFMIA